MNTNLAFFARRRSRYVIWLLSMGVLASMNARAADSEYDAALRSRIDSQESCYAGSFATYDSWTSALSQRNPNFNRNLLPSRETYERFQRELDCRWILYRSEDGQLVNGFIIVPKRILGTKERLPIVVYSRGGSPLAPGPVVMGSMLGQQFPLAVEGFIVVGSQYRGLRSRLLGPDRDPGRDEFGGVDVKDVTTLVDLAASLPHADANKIGMYGWSRGSMQSFLASRSNPRVRAIAVGGTLVDLEDWREFRPEVNQIYEQVIPDPPESKSVALRERSAILWAEQLPNSAPILLLHGTADDRSPFRQSVAMSQRLHELNHPHELVLIGGGSHGLGEHQAHVNELVIAWFKRYLVRSE